MYRKGDLVVHPEYGLGRFTDIFGKNVRIAVVFFRGRGRRHIVLPTPHLVRYADIGYRVRAWRHHTDASPA